MKDKHIILSLILVLLVGGIAQADMILTASWYSVESLKKEGTYKYSKGVMVNGKLFDDNKLTCAVRCFPLGAVLRITNISNNRYVVVEVADRIGKRFGKTRIDLSRLAFSKLDKLEKGLISVKVERIK